MRIIVSMISIVDYNSSSSLVGAIITFNSVVIIMYYKKKILKGKEN